MGLFSGGGFFSPGHGLFGGGDSGPNYGTSTNPNPFLHGIDPETAYKTRAKAKRIYSPAMGALEAGGQLLQPTVDLARRSGQAYAGLYGDIAPQYLAAYRNANPETSGLLSQLTSGATQLTAPGYNNPYEDRLLQQSVRGAQSARGLGYGSGAALEELLGLDRARESRTIARGNYGAGITQLGQGYYSPLLLGLASQYQNPVHPTSTEDLLSLSVNDTMQRRNEHAARIAGNQALWGSAIQAVGGLAGGAAAACWVAEELYGVDDPRTHLARGWVMAHPENEFVKLYKANGKLWAKWLAGHPWAKPIVQPIWDRMWKSELNRELTPMDAN